MADESTITEGEGAEPDYKALWEAAKAETEKWKSLSRRNEGKAKTNAEAAKANAEAARNLEEANQQLADLTERLSKIEGENKALQDAARRKALVGEVAAETGVPEPIVSTLAADDKKALTAAAKAIADAYKTPGGAPAAPEAGKLPAPGGGTASTNADKFAELFSQQLGI